MDRDHCRELLRWPHNARIVLFNASHGEGGYNKNPQLAGAVVKLVSERDGRVLMKTMARNKKEQVRMMLNAADCLLVTSLQEGSPNIVKEAMATNLPVVTVRCGDVAERLANTRPGAVCPHYNAPDLATLIETVLEAGDRSNGREQLALQGLSATAVGLRLAEIYRSLITSSSEHAFDTQEKSAPAFINAKPSR
jgi:glycosyltransferase involved in cell wall biosynthesis